MKSKSTSKQRKKSKPKRKRTLLKDDKEFLKELGLDEKALGDIDVQIERFKAIGSMTFKESVFLREFFHNGGNATRAVLKAYNITDPDNPRGYATANAYAAQLKKKFRLELGMLMDLAGLTPFKVLKKTADGLEAKKWDRDKQDFLPDHTAQHNYVKTASEMLGLTKKGGRAGDAQTVNQFNVFNVDPGKADDFNKNFKDFLDKQVRGETVEQEEGV